MVVVDDSIGLGNVGDVLCVDDEVGGNVVDDELVLLGWVLMPTYHRRAIQHHIP